MSDDLVPDETWPLRSSEINAATCKFAVAAIERLLRILEGNHPMNGLGDLTMYMDNPLEERIRKLRSRIHDVRTVV